MEKEIIQGSISGQRRRGRPRTRWQDSITKWTGLTGDPLKIEVNGGILSMKRPILGSRTAKGSLQGTRLQVIVLRAAS